MRNIKIGELKKHIELFDKANVPLMIYGTFGIGKSDIVRSSAKDKAEKYPERTYIDWMASSDEVKLDALKNPSKYFALIDIRLSQMEPSDIRGIPNIFNTQELPCLQTIPWSWVMYITRPDACGTLFLDEINLAAPQIAASAYQIINDRVISDRHISPGVNIVAAGNTTRDTDIVYDMPNPLKDRFAELEVAFDSQAWLNEWAPQHCHPMIYSFCTFKESWIHHLSENDSDKHVTPRGIERASKIINMFAKDSKGLEITPFLFDAIAGCVGNGWTVQFKAYLSVYQNLDFTKILANPESVADNSLYDTEKRYAIIGGCTERILSVLKDKKLSADEKNKKLVQLITVIVYLPSNLFVLAWKQIKAQNKVKEVLEIITKNKDCFKLLQDRHAAVLNKIVQ
ncbi:MAG: hypothetical protein E7035_03285 [Verrucomicrobiaceae bacterium]|nr:hypothetical protein [Verrucomicrobiaceae bacterium]